MKIVIVAGAPSSGKTSVIISVISHLKNNGMLPVVAKMDCINSSDADVYKKHGIPAITGLSKNMCPDHFLAINLEHIMEWAINLNANMLIIETAGLCNRCAPFINASNNICVIDSTANIKSPEKLGPMGSTADTIVFTKTDIISQIERQILINHVMKLNKDANHYIVNGYTGAGAQMLYKSFMNGNEIDSISDDSLKYEMPSAICSYCVGETRIGKAYHQGIIEYMDINEQGGI
jgi:Ni2+-binding GTPase involved in maturation of urease and hydrogenase